MLTGFGAKTIGNCGNHLVKNRLKLIIYFLPNDLGVCSNCISLWMYGITLEVYTGVVYFVLSGFALFALFIVVGTFCCKEGERDNGVDGGGGGGGGVVGGGGGGGGDREAGVANDERSV